MRWLAPVLLLTLVTLAPLPAAAQVHIDIGINLPGPPTFTVVPGVPVYYAPAASANVFFYANQYWAFTNGGWYVGPRWNGPWAVVAPGYVPAPILRVPVGYYHVPPGHWKGWKREAPPHWEATYGREWHEEAHERNWREREEHDRGRHEGRQR
jgi:hypothetical protein